MGWWFRPARRPTGPTEEASDLRVDRSGRSATVPIVVRALVEDRGDHVAGRSKAVENAHATVATVAGPDDVRQRLPDPYAEVVTEVDVAAAPNHQRSELEVDRRFKRIAEVNPATRVATTGPQLDPVGRDHVDADAARRSWSRINHASSAVVVHVEQRHPVGCSNMAFARLHIATVGRIAMARVRTSGGSWEAGGGGRGAPGSGGGFSVLRTWGFHQGITRPGGRRRRRARSGRRRSEADRTAGSSRSRRGPRGRTAARPRGTSGRSTATRPRPSARG